MFKQLICLGFAARMNEVRPYRAEILSAAMQQEEQIWVNGSAHDLTPETLGKGLILKRLGVCLR